MRMYRYRVNKEGGGLLRNLITPPSVPPPSPIKGKQQPRIGYPEPRRRPCGAIGGRLGRRSRVGWWERTVGGALSKCAAP